MYRCTDTELTILCSRRFWRCLYAGTLKARVTETVCNTKELESGNGV